MFSVGTWDPEAQAYTPQAGCDSPWLNVDARGLRRHLRELRKIGYSAHRRRTGDGAHDDNDTYVLVERTDGMSEAEVLEAWKR